MSLKKRSSKALEQQSGGKDLRMPMTLFIYSYKNDYPYNASHNKQHTEFSHVYSPLSINIATKNIIKEKILPPMNIHNGMFTTVTNLPITIAPKASLPISPVSFEIFSLCLFVSFTIKVYFKKTLKSRMWQ